MDEFERTSEIARTTLGRMHEEAARRDDTVAPIGRPYWADGELLSQVGLMGLDARKRTAADPSTDPSLLALMSGDPDASVRAIAASNASFGVDAGDHTAQMADQTQERLEWYDLGLQARDQGEIDESIRLFTKAADAGLKPAIFTLGQIHKERGDIAEARHWLGKAADAGNPRARHELNDLDSTTPN